MMPGFQLLYSKQGVDEPLHEHPSLTGKSVHSGAIQSISGQFRLSKSSSEKIFKSQQLYR